MQTNDIVTVRPGVTAKVWAFPEVPPSASKGRLVILKCWTNATNLRCYNSGQTIARWEGDLS